MSKATVKLTVGLKTKSWRLLLPRLSKPAYRRQKPQQKRLIREAPLPIFHGEGDDPSSELERQWPQGEAIGVKKVLVVVISVTVKGHL